MYVYEALGSVLARLRLQSCVGFSEGAALYLRSSEVLVTGALVTASEQSSAVFVRTSVWVRLHTAAW